MCINVDKTGKSLIQKNCTNRLQKRIPNSPTTLKSTTMFKKILTTSYEKINPMTSTENPHHLFQPNEEFWLEKVHHKINKKNIKHSLNEIRDKATVIFGINFN